MSKFYIFSLILTYIDESLACLSSPIRFLLLSFSVLFTAVRCLFNHHGAQQLENLGLVNTRPRLRALEYSEMLVTLMLCFVSRSLSMSSASVLLRFPLTVVWFKFALCSGSLYCWLDHIRECFLAVTSKAEGSRDSITGLLIWACWLITFWESRVSEWAKLLLVMKSLWAAADGPITVACR